MSGAGRWFLATLTRGPRWDDARERRAQDGWDEHARFMDALVDDGFVVLGGPVGDGTRVLLACRAADEDVVRARLREDPWSGELLEVASVEPWDALLDGTR